MPVAGSVIFCDDIRFENNGKMLLIGVYQENLVPGILPQALAMSFWVRLTGVLPGEHSLSFTVGANGVDQMSAGLSIVVQEGSELSHLSLVGLPIELKDYGHVFLTISGLPGDESFHAKLPVIAAGTESTRSIASH